MKKFKSIFSEFFMSKGKIKPPYVWISLFLITVLQMVYLKMYGPEKLAARISSELILGCLGFVMGWLGIYTWFDKNTRVPSNIQERISEAVHPEEQPPVQ